jgi:putative intracellular protease/amidase
MNNESVLEWIRRQAGAARNVLSVCTGALLCGAAGLLRGRRAATHWSCQHLLPYFGATPVDARVVVDGNWVFAAGGNSSERLHSPRRLCLAAPSGSTTRPQQTTRRPVFTDLAQADDS